MYSIEFTPDAEKFLGRLDAQTRERIVKAIERLQIRPHAYITRLVNDPLYKFRVGDYRVLLDVKDDKLYILVVEIGHRKNVYKKR